MALFESFNVIGKLFIYIKSHLSFSRSAYFKFLLVSLTSSSFYILSFISQRPYVLVLALALEGLWRGSLERMESILITEIDKSSRESDQETLQHSKNFGLLCGPVIGYFVKSYFQFDQLGLDLPDLSFPGFIQLICVVLMILIHFAVSFRIYNPGKLKASESGNYNRTESETMGNASVENNKKVESNHLYIFIALFIILNYSFSKSVKEVALPILINQDGIFSNCTCKQLFSPNFVYLAFAFSAFFEFIGTIVAYRPRRVSVKKIIYIPIVLTIAGNALMISNESIIVLSLAIGIVLQCCSSHFGLICGRTLYVRYVGGNAPVKFTLVRLFLEFIGSLIGPFYTMQAYMVKCGLCFSMVTLVFSISFILLVYAHIKKHYANKAKENALVSLDSRPNSEEKLNIKRHRTLLRKSKTILGDIEMAYIKKSE